MFNKKMLFFCIIIAVITAALQSVPRIWGSVYAFVLIPCGLPVYITARLKYSLGIVMYLSVAVLSAYINMSEALFFICVSGVIGLTLGIMKDLFRSIYTVPIPSVLIVFSMLSIINYFFGINIYGSLYQRTLFHQALSLMPPLYIYCLIYLRLSILAEALIHRNLKLGNY